MENQKQGNGLKIATWVFIVLTDILLFGIGVLFVVLIIKNTMLKKVRSYCKLGLL